MVPIRNIIRIGLPSGITQAIFSSAMMVVQSLTNSFGEMVIACNVIVMRVDGFAMMPNFTFGQTMTTYTGQNIGARRLDRVHQGAVQGTAIAVGVSAVLTGLILLFGRQLMGLFTQTEDLIVLSMRMMSILAVGYIAVSITQSLSGVMRGAGDTMTPMWISLITTVILRVPTAYGLVYLSRSEEYPNGRPEALFVSMLVAWILGMVITIIAYRFSKWRKRMAQEEAAAGVQCSLSGKHHAAAAKPGPGFAAFLPLAARFCRAPCNSAAPCAILPFAAQFYRIFCDSTGSALRFYRQSIAF